MVFPDLKRKEKSDFVELLLGSCRLRGWGSAYYTCGNHLFKKSDHQRLTGNNVRAMVSFGCESPNLAFHGFMFWTSFKYGPWFTVLAA